MKILCVSWFDNGGQMATVTNALNKYTDHTCKHLNFVQTYLGYDVDISYTDCTERYIKSLIDETEFFIFSETIPNQLIKLGIIKKLKRNNMILRCYGTPSRKQLDHIRSWWNMGFGVLTSGGLDPTIHPYIGFTVYHIPNIYEFNNFPKPNKSNQIKICHASTNFNVKNTKHVIKTLNDLQKKYDIEPIIISETSWTDTLQLKASCHITIDQFIIGAYAGSAIESMFLRHAVVSRVSPLVRSFHPELPIIQATTDNLYSILENMLNNPSLIEKTGAKGYYFSLINHSVKHNIIKWNYLIEWMISGFN